MNFQILHLHFGRFASNQIGIQTPLFQIVLSSKRLSSEFALSFRQPHRTLYWCASYILASLQSCMSFRRWLQAHGVHGERFMWESMVCVMVCCFVCCVDCTSALCVFVAIELSTWCSWQQQRAKKYTIQLNVIMVQETSIVKRLPLNG